MKKLLSLLSFFLLAESVAGQIVDRRDTIGVKVYFRQGQSVLEPDFHDNESRLQEFIALYRAFEQDTTCHVRGIRIEGGASPEGSTQKNKQLSDNRAKCISEYLHRYLSFHDTQIVSISRGVNWEGLTRMVEASDMPYKAKVLDILYHTPEWIVRNGVVVDGRKRQLAMLQGGRAWWYMEEYFFPELRSSGVQISCEFERIVIPEPEPILEPIIEPVPDPEPVADSIPEPVVEETITSTTSKSFYMAVKTNMLYDVLAVPNIGVEFYLGRNWSIAANWMYAWWKTDRKHWYWRTYGGDLELRKWLGSLANEKPLTGHHIGLYGQITTYDFEMGGRGYLGDRWSYGVGISYGYSLPIARRLNLDFTVGIGYLGGEYKEYLPIDNHYVWQTTKQRHWFGPTKAEISLVWLISQGNYNKQKGDVR